MNPPTIASKIDQMLLNAQLGRSYWTGRTEALADVKNLLAPAAPAEPSAPAVEGPAAPAEAAAG